MVNGVNETANEKRTALYDAHVRAGARMTSFAGWSMPLRYGSQVAEHRQVRSRAGMFDVSHMTIIDIDGDEALALLQRVFANDPGKTESGKAVYGVLLNETGGIIDDVMVYARRQGYRIVANAATRERVLQWLEAQRAGFAANVSAREDLAMIAVQGPRALALVEAQTAFDVASLAPFGVDERDDWFLSRTGYTGEDGVEIMLPNGHALELWQRLEDAGVLPVGLAARDTLRLEAGLNLYGQDMDEDTTPLESNLGWSIAWQPERDFIGRAALQALRDRGATGEGFEAPRKLTGLVLEAKGVMRHGQRVQTSAGEGVVTSGVFSPTLGYSIALARLPRRATGSCTVRIRNDAVAAQIVKPPFVRHGKKVYRESRQA